jgi:hypothetical protein
MLLIEDIRQKGPTAYGDKTRESANGDKKRPSACHNIRLAECTETDTRTGSENDQQERQDAKETGEVD